MGSSGLNGVTRVEIQGFRGLGGKGSIPGKDFHRKLGDWLQISSEIREWSEFQGPISWKWLGHGVELLPFDDFELSCF